ncbi:MAG: hypothetical protein V4722_08270 [Bacteroidota bacterium]
MKPLIVPITLFSLILSGLVACKKDKDPIAPPVVVKADTLTTGWSKKNITRESLSDVFFLNSATGYTLGDTVYKTTDGGSNWSKLALAKSALINMAVTPDGKIFVVNKYDSIYRSVNAGATFTGTRLSPGHITDIFFLDNNTGFACSSAGLSKTTDGGASWLAVSPLTGLTTTATGDYASLYFVNATTGWLSMKQDIFKTNGGINNWAQCSYGTTAPVSIQSSLFATSANVVYAGINNGNLYKSTNGGANFSLAASFISGSGYLDIHFTSANIGYACFGKRIYRTTDAGANWQPVVSLGEQDVIEIHFTDANHGWGCTSGGSILIYNQ